MPKYSIIFFVLLLSAFHLRAQSESGNTDKKKNALVGFYGNRFMFQFGAGIHHNSLLKLLIQEEKNYRDWYTELHNSGGSDQVNYSFYGSLGIQLEERVAFSFDFNYYYGNMVIEDYGYSPSYSGNPAQGKTARIDYKTIRFMPRLEFGSRGSNSPAGLSHIVGIGIELSKGQSKKYDAIISDTTDDYIHYTYGSFQESTAISFTNKPAYNLTLLYGMEYRFPLSRNFALNLGGYFNLNIPLSMLEQLDFSYSSYDSKDLEFKRDLSINRMWNLFSVRTGLIVML